MNKIQKLANAITMVKGGWDSVFLKNIPFEDDRLFSDVYKKSELVYICITTTARAIGQVPLRVCERNRAGVLEPVSPDNPWQMLLYRPNPLMDMYSFVEASVSYLLLDGNVWLIPFPPGNEVPDSIWVVQKKNIDPIRDIGTGQLIGWEYRPNNSIKPIKLSVDEVCHIWFWNPYDPILGMAPIEAGKIAIETDYKSSQFNRIFFESGGSPSGVVTSPGKIGATQYERMKQQLLSEHAGYKKAHRLMILEQGLQYTQVGLSQKDMQFTELRKYNKEEILQIFGMKKSIISVTDDLNYATSKEQRKSWWQDTNLPIMKLIISAMNFVFFNDNPNEKILFDTTMVEALQQELQDKVTIAKDLVNMGFTANEVNKALEMGFEEKPWRDYWFKPLAVEAVGEDYDPSQEEPEEEPPQLPPGQSPPLLPAPPEEEPEEEFVANRRIKTSDWETEAMNISNDLNIEIAPIEKTFESKIKRIFFDMRKKTLEALLSETKSRRDVENLDFQKEERLIRKEAGTAFEASMKKGALSASKEVGKEIAWDLSDPNAISHLAQKTLKVTGISSTIKKRIKLSLQEGFEAGESVEEVANRIKGVFNNASNRAKTIARTELHSTANFGRHESLESTNFGEFQWFTALDERVRPSHAVMHGKTRKKGESWVLPSGATLKHPGDYSGPPGEIINCRCIEVIVPDSYQGYDSEETLAIPDEDIQYMKANPNLKGVSEKRMKRAIKTCYSEK